jgi:predicted TPR repeat methyltransferase
MTKAGTEQIALRLRFANTLKKAGLYQDAVDELEAIVVDDPECAPAYNNMGAICFLCKDYQSAIYAYQMALDIRPDYFDVYYNLGLAYLKNSQLDAAETAFSALISLVPTHAGAHFQLASLMMQRQQYELATEQFTTVVKAHPHHVESLTNLASCLLHLGKVTDSVVYYLQALEIMPNDKDILFNLGVIYMQQGYAENGLEYYLRAVKAHPDFFAAHHNLGAIYLMRRNREKSLLHFREALRIQPKNEALRHTIKILMQDTNLSGSSPAYIESLFDSYAAYYDAHLRSHLHYQVPEKLHAMLQQASALTAQSAILDLGCGTGLCGEIFKPYASHLVGVDLSTKMLEVAKQKQVYDELVVSEAVTYLSNHAAAYELILAGDVLVYFGELNPLILAVSQALKPNGYFAFNVEAALDVDYVLTVSGRFVHQKEYLERVAREYDSIF